MKAEILGYCSKLEEATQAVKHYSKAATRFGYVGTAIQIVDSVGNIYNDYSSGGISNIDVLDVADVGFTILGTFGGPVGLGISSVYYICRISNQ